MNMEKHSDSVSWKSAPIIVGGTGGSGTRGVVDVLDKLGIYMHPAIDSDLFKDCYNGAMDNGKMYPESGKLKGMKDTGKVAGEDYIEWLLSDTCTPRKELVPFVTQNEGLRYIASVPKDNMKPYRWGWKNPKTMYHLEVLLHLYPNLMFIQVVRNPFDMVSVQFEHLHNRATEFSGLHNGYEAAVALSNFRCLKMSPQNPKSCLLTASALETVAQCQTNGQKCVKETDIKHKNPWQCMHMQLWAQMNSASYVFGVRCLNIENRFLVWHGEDVYGNRGPVAQEQLQHRLAEMLDMPFKTVSKMFINQRGRRLDYGKYLGKSGMNLTRLHMCAEAAVPGAMDAFHYDFKAMLKAQAQIEAPFKNRGKGVNDYKAMDVSVHDAQTQLVPTTGNYFDISSSWLLVFSSFALLLIWCRKSNGPEASRSDTLIRVCLSWPCIAVILYNFTVYFYTT